MSTVTAEQVQTYLDATYLTQAQLAERAGVTPARVAELEAAQCIPGASYRVEGDFRIASTFGHFELPVPETRYYHPSIARWVEKAEGLAKSHDLEGVARIMRLDFTRELATRVNGRTTRDTLKPEQAWAYVTDGTWGLCIKDIAPEYMIAKEMARLTFAGAPEEPTEAEREVLESAAADYERVALPFAPHELDISSRRQEFEPAVEKYGLVRP